MWTSKSRNIFSEHYVICCKKRSNFSGQMFFHEINKTKVNICCNTHTQERLPGKPFCALFIS